MFPRPSDCEPTFPALRPHPTVGRRLRMGYKELKGPRSHEYGGDFQPIHFYDRRHRQFPWSWTTFKGASTQRDPPRRNCEAPGTTIGKVIVDKLFMNWTVFLFHG